MGPHNLPSALDLLVRNGAHFGSLHISTVLLAQLSTATTLPSP